MLSEWLTMVRLKWKALIHRRKLDHDLEEELRFHLDMRAQEKAAEGIESKDAYFAALRKFGSATLIRESCRELWSFAWLEILWRDVCLGARIMRRRPGTTAAVLASLALGIGINTAVFSVFYSTVLKPLPYDKSDELAVFTDDRGRLDYTSPVIYRSWKQIPLFQELAMFNPRSVNLTGGGVPERLQACFANATIFDVLRVKPFLGRTYSQSEDDPHGERSVVLSSSFWQRGFGGNPSILGKTICLSDQTYTVIGVMPPGFAFPTTDVDLWSPYNVEFPDFYQDIRMEEVENYVLARLKPGISCAAAAVAVNRINEQLRQQNPKMSRRRPEKRILPLQHYILGRTRSILIMVMVAVTLVLLIACVNVANLILMVGESRRRETGIKLALGASGKQILQGCMAESLLLSLPGGLAGLLLAFGLVRYFVSIAPATMPRLNSITIDGWVLAYALGLTIASSIIAAILPAMKRTRSDLASELKEGGAGTPVVGSRGRMRDFLVAFELALAMMLLAGAGLMTKSAIYQMRRDLGFEPGRVLTVLVEVPMRKAMKSLPGPHFLQMEERVSQLPGVESVGLSTELPLSPAVRQDFTLERISNSPREIQIMADWYDVTPGHFRTMKIPVLLGRMFSDSEVHAKSQVVIINQMMAEKYWPGENPVGKRLRRGTLDYKYIDWLTIVGVVGNVCHRRLGTQSVAWEEPVEQVYYPMQITYPYTMMEIRSRLPIQDLTDSVRREIAAVDPEQPVSEAKTMESLVLEYRAEPLFYMNILGIFAAFSVVLTGLGTFGVVSYSVKERSYEFAVRIAMGAQRRHILQQVLRKGLLYIALGLAPGLAGGIEFARLIARLVPGVTGYNAATIGAVAAFFSAAIILACYFPARAAADADPLTILRQG